jgi:TetR/AcrR family transcriptional regulator
MASRRPAASAKAAPVKRGKGWPKSGATMVGREALVNAARTLLKSKPPKEITRQEVARFAEVDPGLIRYYFGNRDGLLTTATTEISQEMHAAMAQAIAAGKSAPEKLSNRIRAFLEMHTTYPYLNELIIEQILYGKTAVAKRARKAMVADSVATLSAIVGEGVNRGELRSVDPRFLHIALIGMCDFFFTGRPVLEEIFGRNAIGRKLTKEYGEFLTDFLMRGLTTSPHVPDRATPAGRRRAPKVKAPSGVKRKRATRAV